MAKKAKKNTARSRKSAAAKPRKAAGAKQAKSAAARPPKAVKGKPRKSSAAKPHKPVIVTVTDAMLPDIHGVAERLVAKGMKVDRVLPMTGVISGSSAASKMSGLKNVSGVMSVEEEAVAELPPPGSPQ